MQEKSVTRGYVFEPRSTFLLYARVLELRSKFVSEKLSLRAFRTRSLDVLVTFLLISCAQFAC